MPLIYSNTQRHENLHWKDYVLLHGYSFSFLKREIGGSPSFVMATDKMLLGSMVDAILMQQDEVDMKSAFFPPGKIVANALMNEFGSMIKHFKSQISYSGTLSHAGLSMVVKGRPDWEIEKKLIVDLKITTATDIRSLISFMGYDNQQNHYSGLAQVPVAYILAYNPKLKRTLPIIKLPYNDQNEWWKSKVLIHGTV